ncbi:MAG: hypothetical protein K2M74_05190, partial [Bacteroidales bacterium]|nr:hypothetical protein [Bacteroidales bacterium]
MKERFKDIAEEWFLTEPLLFAVYCSHRLVEVNPKDSVVTTVLRSGKGRIEYNPSGVATLERASLEEFLRMEMIRILLKHPYQRQPKPTRKDVCYWASDLVLQDAYTPKVRLFRKDDFVGTAFPGYAAAFEEYYRCLLPLSEACSGFNDEHGGSGDTPSENSEQEDERGKGNEQMRQRAERAADLWGEDQMMQETIDRLIEVAEQSQSWGSLKGRMRELIMASLQAKIDCSKILNGFRGSVLSSKRVLTRMRPSRRYGFDYMGSRHQFATRLLVAVDVSGSVPSESLRQFFGIVNRFFKYGIDKIDVLQFDNDIKGEPISLKRAMKEIRVAGRGGTDYQKVFDFACDDGAYDGLILCTDGFAAPPRLRKNIP